MITACDLEPRISVGYEGSGRLARLCRKATLSPAADGAYRRILAGLM